jgi:site-specific recombinase XerD
LLGHVAMQRRGADSQRVRTVNLRREPSDAPGGTVYAFDERHFERLVHSGFARNAPPGAALHRRLRLRDLMITLLLHGGGLRESEPFHLFVGDVDVDPDRPEVARVRVYHPENGAAPAENERRWRDRAHYMRERWNLEPRTRLHGRYHAGWKDLALTDQRHRFAQIFWFPDQWGRVFLRLYRAYLKVRPRANHPFLFVSERPAHRGDPYTIAAFEQAHARAIRRIGLVPRKHDGTTPHAHRHSYGRAMADAGLDRLYRQRALHHRSPNAQDVYTVPDTAAVNAAMSEASVRVWGQSTTQLPSMENDDED